jgi:hypothetical protein
VEAGIRKAPRQTVELAVRCISLTGRRMEKNIPSSTRVRFFKQVTSSAIDSASIAEVVSVTSVIFCGGKRKDMLLNE